MPTIVRDIGGASFYTWAALYDRCDRRRRLDRHGVVTPWRSARLYARRRRFCDGHGLLRAGAKHRLADRSAGSTKTGLRCAGSDCRLELRPSSRPAGERAQDRQVDPGSAVCFNPLAAVLRRSGDATGVDQCIADRPLGSVSIPVRPSCCYRCRLCGMWNEGGEHCQWCGQYRCVAA